MRKQAFDSIFSILIFDSSIWFNLKIILHHLTWLMSHDSYRRSHRKWLIQYDNLLYVIFFSCPFSLVLQCFYTVSHFSCSRFNILPLNDEKLLWRQQAATKRSKWLEKWAQKTDFLSKWRNFGKKSFRVGASSWLIFHDSFVLEFFHFVFHEFQFSFPAQYYFHFLCSGRLVFLKKIVFDFLDSNAGFQSDTC